MILGNVREPRNIIERNVIINLSKYNEDTLSVIPDIPDKDLLQYDYFKLLGLSGSLKDSKKLRNHTLLYLKPAVKRVKLPRNWYTLPSYIAN